METILVTVFGRIVQLQKGESDSLAESAAALISDTNEKNKYSKEQDVMTLSESNSM